MIKLTERDYEIINFVKEYKAVDINTIARLYFPSLATAEKRLRKLVESKKLNRSRANILEPYVYYRGTKPTNIKHSLALSQVYSILQSEYEVVKCKREWECKYYNKVLRPDLMLVIRRYGKLFSLFIEVDLSKSYKNKYDTFITSNYYQNYFPMQPIIVVISNRTPSSSIDLVWLKLDEVEKIGSLL